MNVDLCKTLEEFQRELRLEAKTNTLKNKIHKAVSEIENQPALTEEEQLIGETAEWCLSAEQDPSLPDLSQHWQHYSNVFRSKRNSRLLTMDHVLSKLPGLLADDEAQAKELIETILRQKREKSRERKRQKT
jgi:hypothetical protein